MILDKDIREPLFLYLDQKYGKNRILEEKRMGRSRADVVMILPDAVCGIEIKSDADSYTRLSRQVKDYQKYYDLNILVVGSSHALHAGEHVPEEWGIISVEEMENGTLDFYEIRKPVLNPSLNIADKLSILWRPELDHIQKKNEMAAYKQKSKAFVIGKIAEKVDYEVLKYQISEELFERDYTAIADVINEFRKENGQKPRRNTKKRKRKYRSL